MTLKQFIEENQVTAFEVVPNVLILNAAVGEAEYGIDVDTSNIPFGTILQKVEEFTIENDILTVGNLSLNTAQTNMLGMNDGNSE
jgi:hypothetical protein